MVRNGVAGCARGLVCFWLGGWCLDFAFIGLRACFWRCLIVVARYWVFCYSCWFELVVGWFGSFSFAVLMFGCYCCLACLLFLLLRIWLFFAWHLVVICEGLVG